MPTSPLADSCWILLHGLFGAPRPWQKAASTFLPGEQVHTLWLPNHGEGPSGSFPTLEALAHALLQAYPDLFTQPKRALILGGYSLGGTLAIRLAQLLPKPPSAVLTVDAYLPNQPYPRQLTQFLAGVATKMLPLQGHHFDDSAHLEQALLEQEIDPITAHALASAYPDAPCQLRLELPAIIDYLRHTPTTSCDHTSSQHPSPSLDAPIHAPLCYREASNSIHTRHVHTEQLQVLSPMVHRMQVPGTTHASIAERLLDAPTVTWLREAAAASLDGHGPM